MKESFRATSIQLLEERVECGANWLMEIGSNTTGMTAGVTVVVDREGHYYYVVSVKGTFAVSASGDAVLAEKQEPLVYSDVHHGDPASTSVRYESDFSRFKARTDVLVNADAWAPWGDVVERLEAWLEVGPIQKRITVFGDRFWDGFLGASTPAPFSRMPLVYERAFGGSDDSARDDEQREMERRNPVGVGFHRRGFSMAQLGSPLPNIEDSRRLIQKWTDRPEPAGFGVIGRSWIPRIEAAGTYDGRWLAERFPFLPSDFRDDYFQAAPPDQQIPYLHGGEQVRCSNMTPDGEFEFRVPKLNVPLAFRFWDKQLEVTPNLDTIIIEPGERRFLLTWRASVRAGHKLNALRAVDVGPTPVKARRRPGKPHFKSLADYIASKKARR